MKRLPFTLIAAGLWLSAGGAFAAFADEGFEARFATEAGGAGADPEEFVLPDDGGEAAMRRLMEEAQEAAPVGPEPIPDPVLADTPPAPEQPPAPQPEPAPVVVEESAPPLPEGEGIEAQFSETPVEAVEAPDNDEVWVNPAIAAAQAEARERRREQLRALRGPYVGIAGGTDHAQLGGGIKDGRVAGMLVGFRLTERYSAELSFSGTDFATPVATCQLQGRNTGLYGVVRTEEAVYLKARFGVLSDTLDSSLNCAGVTRDEIVGSVGAGFGARMGRAAAELEYTLIGEDVYRVGWSLRFDF